MEKYWLNTYPDDVPMNIDANEYASIVEYVAHCIESGAEKSAFNCMGKSITYYELDKLSDNFCSYLQNKLKIKKGDRIAIMMPNLLQFPIIMLGILKAGAVVVNVNPLYTAPELTHQLNDSGAIAVVVMNSFAHVVQKVMQNTPLEHVIITEFGDLMGFKGKIVNFVLKYIKRMVPSCSISGAIKFKQTISNSKLNPINPVQLSGEDLAFLQYTGGTTGVAKGAMLSHQNIIANVMQLSEWLSCTVTRGSDVVIQPLPMYHIYALTTSIVFLNFNSDTTLIPNPRDRKGLIKILKERPFHFFIGLNTLFNALLDDPEFASVDFSSLKQTIAGGMAVQESVAQQWNNVTGCWISQGYGLTETSPVVSSNRMDISGFNGSVGVPLPSTHVCVQDDKGEKLPIGEVGEICVKGPQVMSGYWHRQRETELTIVNGWLHTGDIGRMDEQGYIYIVDRKKDMVIVSGFNVYPNEVEDVIAMHPAVHEVAVIGVPHPKTGEAVKAFIVKQEDEVTPAELIAYCRKHLTPYKVPKIIEFRNELPKSNVGKILRRKLRDEDADQSDQPDQPADQSAVRPVDRPADQPVDKPADRPENKPENNEKKRLMLNLWFWQQL